MPPKKSHLLISGAVTLILLTAMVAFAVTMFLLPPKEWREVRSHIYPQLTKVSHKEQIPIVTRPFSPDLDLTYVVDEPKRYTFVQEEKREEWGVTEEDLYSQALENLEELVRFTELKLSSATGEDTGKYITVETGDGYDAVKILSSDVRSRVAGELGEVFIAAIPVRDFLIFWHPDFSLSEEFLEQVQAEFEKEDIYNLTANPFLVTSEGIQPLKIEETE